MAVLDLSRPGAVPDLSFADDFYDAGHLTYRGAEKVAPILADFLASTCRVPDRSGDPVYARWWAQHVDKRDVFLANKLKTDALKAKQTAIAASREVTGAAQAGEASGALTPVSAGGSRSARPASPQHVAERLDARARPRFGGVDVEAEAHHGEAVLAREPLQGGERVDLGQAAERLDVDDAVEPLAHVLQRVRDALRAVDPDVVPSGTAPPRRPARGCSACRRRARSRCRTPSRRGAPRSRGRRASLSMHVVRERLHRDVHLADHAHAQRPLRTPHLGRLEPREEVAADGLGGSGEWTRRRARGGTRRRARGRRRGPPRTRRRAA